MAKERRRRGEKGQGELIRTGVKRNSVLKRKRRVVEEAMGMGCTRGAVAAAAEIGEDRMGWVGMYL